MKRGSLTIVRTILSAIAVAVAMAFAGQGDNAKAGTGSTLEKQAYENYIKIQVALAADSIKGVAEAAQAIAQAVRADADKKLPAAAAEQAEKVAKATDIASAREAFKALSKTLIDYRKKNQSLMAQYHEVYCPMADASWLQPDKNVKNPYFGSSMLHCGTIKN
jgi:Cu(I)/Ag(I) efflux system membrane fusion protein